MKAALSMPKALMELYDQLAELGEDIDQVAAESLDAGADVVLAGMKKRVPVDTGDLKNQLKKGKVKRDGNVTMIEIGQVGEDSKISPRDAIKANVNEFGSSSMPAQPFVRPTMTEDKSKINKAMRKPFIDRGIVEK